MRFRLYELKSLLLTFLILVSCSSSYQLIGKVQDKSSTLIPNAVVIVKDLSKNDSTKTYTNAQGSFIIDELKTSNVEVIIRAPKYLPLSRRINLIDKINYEFFELQRRPTIVSGMVINKNKKPVSNVQVIDGMGQILAFTDQSGKFTIDRGFNPNLELLLTLKKNGFKPTYRTIKPILYQNNNLGTILLDSLPVFIDQTTAKKEVFSRQDQDVSHAAMAVSRTGRINEFLKNREQFTYQDFADLLHQIDMNMTDEEIMQQLQGMIELNKVEEEDDGSYRSLIYQSD